MIQFLSICMLVVFAGTPLAFIVIRKSMKSRVADRDKKLWQSNGWTTEFRGFLVTFTETGKGQEARTRVAPPERNAAIMVATTETSGMGTDPDVTSHEVVFVGNPRTTSDLRVTLEQARANAEPCDGDELPRGDTRVMDATAWSRVNAYLKRIGVSEVRFAEHWFFVNGTHGHPNNSMSAAEALALVDLLTDVARASQGQNPSDIDHKATLDRIRRYEVTTLAHKRKTPPPEGSIHFSDAVGRV